MLESYMLWYSTFSGDFVPVMLGASVVLGALFGCVFGLLRPSLGVIDSYD